MAIVEGPRRAIELDVTTLLIEGVNRLANAPSGRIAEVLPPTALYGKDRTVEILGASSCAVQGDFLIAGAASTAAGKRAATNMEVPKSSFQIFSGAGTQP